MKYMCLVSFETESKLGKHNLQKSKNNNVIRISKTTVSVV